MLGTDYIKRFGGTRSSLILQIAEDGDVLPSRRMNTKGPCSDIHDTIPEIFVQAESHGQKSYLFNVSDGWLVSQLVHICVRACISDIDTLSSAGTMCRRYMGQ